MQTSDGLAIDLKNVTKVYRGRVHALAGIEMKVSRGEVFGLLGPNGAGKSTLVKIMMTVIRPTHAEGAVLGQPVGHKPTLQRIGYLPENHRFPKYLTGRQTLEFFGALAKVDRKTARKRAGELLDVVGMSAWGDAKISTYSKGMLQRVGIGQALMSDPDLVVLDEPTDGVDPVGRRDIRDVLARIREQGKTVFINSHLLSELEMVCTRVAILVQGKVARQGTIDDLTAKSQRYEIDLDPPARGPAALPAAISKVLSVNLTPTQRTGSSAPPSAYPYPSAQYPGVPMTSAPPAMGFAPVMPGEIPLAGMAPGMPPLPGAAGLPLFRGTLSDGIWVELDGPTLTVGTADARRVQPILDALRVEGLTIRRLTPVRQSLEDLFMEAVTDPKTGLAYGPGAARGGRP